MSDQWVFSLNVPSEKGSSKLVQLQGGQKPISNSINGSHHSDTDGWTLVSSSGWSLQSRNVLQVTHRPAWQALPEFTGMSLARDMSRRACCRTRSKHVDFTTNVYTIHDIEQVQQNVPLKIRGIGECKGVQLKLKPHHIITPPPITETLREALQKQWDLPPNDTNDFSRFSERADSLSSSPNDDFIVITFATPLQADSGPLLYKVELPANKHIAVETITVLDGALTAQKVEPSHIYINGYQSWSFTGSVAKGRPQPTSALPNVYSKAFSNGGSPTPKDTVVVGGPASLSRKDKTYKSDFFTCISSDRASAYETRQNDELDSLLLDEAGGPALVLGWLSQHEHFGVMTVDSNLTEVEMHASAQGQIWKRAGWTDWCFLQILPPHGYDEEPMVHFLHAVAAYNEARPLQNGSLLTGWCSWYHYYEDISASNLRENFETLQALRNKVPTNVAIVDDGYMTAWGDWSSLKPKAFPDGEHSLREVAQDVRKHGLRPGLWLAPFACDRKSQLAKDYPDWIIWNSHGRNANSSNCGKFFLGLDATNPAVREYVYNVVRRAIDNWEYEVLKIDFLYAACLEGNGKYDLSVSRAQAMHMALQTIRHAAGKDTFLIGCGCPLGTGVGYVDGMRVSADTGPTWYPAFPLPWWDNSTLPSLRGMIRNSMSRACMGHRWWHNDPDCLLLGNSTKLNDSEVASAASIVAMTCGMLLLSDDLTKLSLSRLRILTKIFPMTGATAVVLDLHSTYDGLPCLLRLWCTDRYNLVDRTRRGSSASLKEEEDNELMDYGFIDHNEESTFFGRRASFRLDEETPKPSERTRNCLHVTKGLGTWTLLSMSNWWDNPAVIHAPAQAIAPPPESGWDDEDNEKKRTDDLQEGPRKEAEYGFHVFAFWPSQYSWMPSDAETLSKYLDPHATEIFHIKPVSLNMPQYIGSDLHFSCGYEVRLFEAEVSSLVVRLKNEVHRTGSIYLYIPRDNMDQVTVKVNGVAGTRKPGGWDVVANTPLHKNHPPSCLGRIIRVWVSVHADRSPSDGEVVVQF